MLIEEILTEKCWKGYEKKGMKTMFGKRVPNCVKREDVGGKYSAWDHEESAEYSKSRIPPCLSAVFFNPNACTL